jgi:hemerythrin
MPLAQWSEAWRTGDDTVDSQHIELFRMVNGLHDAIVAGQGREQLTATLDALAAYVGTHFQTEERLMQQGGYPGFPVHKAKHEELKKNAAKVIDDYRSGRAVLTISLSRFLADWIRHHIDGEDRAMIRYFQARNANPPG